MAAEDFIPCSHLIQDLCQAFNIPFEEDLDMEIIWKKIEIGIMK
jgi:hypothetical protein